MVRLTLWLHTARQSDEIVAAQAGILRCVRVYGHHTFVKTLVVMSEYSGNVYAVRAWHTVGAGCARNGLHAADILSNIIKEVHFLVCQWLQWTVGEEVILQMFHICHAAKNGEHILWCASIAECP